MGKINTFTDLIMWQKSHDFVLEAYKITENYPKNDFCCKNYTKMPIRNNFI